MEPQKRKIGCGFRTAIWGIVIIGGLVLGFIFLLRSCLGQFDNYGVVGFPGITEDQKSMVIVKAYNTTTSYSSGSKGTYKSYSTTYYIEKIDLETGKVTGKKKLMNKRKLKNYVFNCYGGYKNKLWVYANYLRAYDMNSLEQVVKLEDIESKNPQLKGKMPTELQYYDEHINLGYITITAQDGDKYNLMLDDLHAELLDPDAGSYDNYNKNFKKEMDDFELKYKAETERIDYNHIRSDYYENKITKKEMENRLLDASNKLDALNKTLDSLRSIEKNARNIFDAQKDLKDELCDFNLNSDDIDDWTIMNDTTAGRGYQFYTEEPKNNSNFNILDFDHAGSESDKVKIYQLTLDYNNESNDYNSTAVTKTEQLGNERYLQGGFVRNMYTGFSYDMKNPGGYIIFSRDIIGDKGKLLVSRVDLNGKQVWQVNTEMSTKIDFTVVAGNYLIITGIINPDKDPFFCSDALRIIDLKGGKLIPVKY